MTAAAPDRTVQRGRLLRLLLIGLALTLPRFALALLAKPPTDALQIAAVFVFVVGLVLVASALVRLWLLRSPRLLPVAVAGVVALLVAGLLVAAFPPGTGAVAYTGGLLAPASAVVTVLAYLLLGALSQLGLFLVLGSVGAALARWALGRAQRRGR